MLKFLFRFFLFIFFTLGLTLLGGYFFIQAAFRPELERMFEETVGVDVEVQSAYLDIKNSKIVASGIKFLSPEGFPKNPMAKLSDVLIDFDWNSIPQKRIIINRVEVTCPETHIFRDSSGQFNWFNIKAFQKGGAFKRTGFMAWMEGWPMLIESFELSLGKTTYTDYAQKPSFKKFILLDLRNLEYFDLGSMMEAVKILAWEALIRVDQNELKEPFSLVKDKIEMKLGTREAFLEKWHEGKSSERLLEETKPSIKALRQPSII